MVIVDSPSVMAVSDAAIVANVGAEVVFVVGTEMTSRHAARAAIEQIEKGHGKVVGAILNRVELERNAFYYSQYYSKKYAAYYVAHR